MLNADLAQIKEVALRLLTRREHAFLELKNKLLLRGFAADAIEAVLLELKEKNLQSDARFTDNYLRYRSAAGFGPRRIHEELRHKGVAELLIKAALAELDDEFWLPIVRTICRKKFKIAADETFSFKQCSYDEQIKIRRFLQYRGFDVSDLDN